MREHAAPPVSRSANAPRAWFATLAVVAGAALITSLAGGFGTGQLPIGMRLFVFAATIGVNAAKWGLWLHLCGRIAPDGKAALVGAGVAGSLLLNLTLPAELELAFAAVGLPQDLPFWPIYASAVLISLTIYFVVAVARAAPAESGEVAPISAAQPLVPPFLAAAGVRAPADLLALRAEDHYLRIQLRDGRAPLVLHRLRDAVAALEGWDGLQVHRSAWVARDAVRGAVRDGRKWRLQLVDDTELPVGASYLAGARAAGLLARTSKTPPQLSRAA